MDDTSGQDLRPPVAERDHRRGDDAAHLTLLVYGDYECPYTRRAQREIDAILADRGDQLRYVYRHFPLTRIHPHAHRAALAAEAAAAQGRFWELHGLLFSHQRALDLPDLLEYAADLGMDVDRFDMDVRSEAYAARVREDVRSGTTSGVRGTPTLFVNGRRREDPFNLQDLLAAADED